MNLLIEAIDSITKSSTCRSGENGHGELNWSDDLAERIVQFDFQCVRTTSDNIANLTRTLDQLLKELSIIQENVEKETSHKELLTTLYKLIARTRDIHGGKGEYTLAYMMILTWFNYFPNLAEKAMIAFMIDPHEFDCRNISQLPYGSWKDAKYLCKYILDNGGDMEHPLIQSCIKGINEALYNDYQIYLSADEVDKSKRLSLVSKWISRESSNKFGFMNEVLAKDYFPEYLATAKNPISYQRAIKKCKTQYRIICSTLNRHIDTVQIKQAQGNWSEIDHSKTTSITMMKNRRAFMNLHKNSQEIRRNTIDRIQCAENFKVYLDSLMKHGKEIKGANVGLNTFALQALSTVNDDELDIIDSQWRDNCNKKNANSLGNMIAIVDTSGSMSGDPLYTALGLGCRVAEKSLLGKRIITFSAEPTWLHLEYCDTFSKMVKKIYREANSGYNTDFYKALDLILLSIEQRRIPPMEVENMVLAIFSDMQIDNNLNFMYNGKYCADEETVKKNRIKCDILYDQIKQKYAAVGMRLYGEPLTPPHILFWNLRHTQGFPCFSTQGNCSMMSGFDPSVLNIFCELGLQGLQELTPIKCLKNILDNERYLPMERIIEDWHR
jgi:hypothetical protein